MRRLSLVCLALGSVAASGCYSLARIPGGSPAPGMRVAFDVNDAGRAALGGSMGPEIDRVEGRLLERNNGDYLLGVTSVSLIRGGVQTWKGEQVVVKPEFVSTVYERRFSPVRTGLAVAAFAGGVAVIMTQDLLGGGAEDDSKTPGDTSQTMRRPGGHRITVLSVPLSKLPFLGRF